MGTASPSAGRVMVTWIAKTALTRIRTTVVSADALAPARMSPVSTLQEKGQRMGQERGQCPHWAWCTLVSSHFLRGATVPHVGRGYVILIIYYYYLLIFGCTGSSIALHSLSLVAVSWGYSLLWCMGVSLQWLLLFSGAQALGVQVSIVAARGLS